ncbi:MULTISPECIES: alpha/beta fold hydrolase [Streptomyces]|uniref:Alpha/beta fold hydrolase n=1 Tax=Streptomyces tendae TaxID=1932 RepID=A0A6B3R2I2_STRTE|nr:MULTISPECIES: alpha/beta hydrolase [Streptomyces]MBQ0966672.1 alpha/beta hydrolase [Streptomyces sp. RK74B]MBQ1007045.1 alpha/beta hydrolase [Streptomyces sp. RK23]MZG13063.1 alpha/beta fold hydrolase [Streptomyces sp. SID5914]NEV92321.1 alpha/beta hydrolase [Streptomyces tendae]
MNRTSRISRARTTMTVLAGAGAAAGLLATTIAPASADKDTTDRGPKPTVVLVHGAFADSTSWNGVIDKLRHDGYPVVAVANPLRSLSGDSAYLKDVLAGIDGPVVLAGHSYGGSVISNAATGNKNVKALVYLAAFLPEKGESAGDLSGRFPGSTLAQALRPVPVTNADGSKGTDFYIQSDKFRQQFAADVPRNKTDLMTVTQRPVTEAALGEGAAEPAWKTIPSWVLVATQDRNIPAAAQEWMARRAGAHTTEVRSSHAVSVSQPGKVTGVIEDAARSVR